LTGLGLAYNALTIWWEERTRKKEEHYESQEARIASLQKDLSETKEKLVTAIQHLNDAQKYLNVAIRDRQIYRFVAWFFAGICLIQFAVIIGRLQG
jgi:t-SNARE complex subunit (syntaxin)